MPAIRAQVIGVFRNGNRILVGDAYDRVKQQLFYCPPGGGVQSGETSVITLRREIREELGCETRHPHLLGVIENLSTLDGISLIDGACPLMYCPPVDFPHRCFRGLFGFFGKLPKPDGEW